MSTQQPVTHATASMCPMPWLPMVITAFMVVLILLTLRYGIDYAKSALQPRGGKRRYDDDDQDDEDEYNEDDDEDERPRRRKNVNRR